MDDKGTVMHDRDYLCEAKAEILKALGHPSRIVIVEELSKGPKCVCELQQAVGSDMSTVSRHLSVMKAAGIVSDRRVGNRVFYHLRLPCVPELLRCVEKVFLEYLESRRTTAAGL